MSTEIISSEIDIPIKEKSRRYLFCWNDIPTKDSARFSKFLRSFGVNVSTAKIEKIDNDKIINIFSGRSILSLSLNSEKTKATLKIDDFRRYEYIVKLDNGKLYVYPKPKITELVDKWILPVNKYHLKVCPLS